MALAVIKVEGMSCQHCVMNVKKTLDALGGVSSTEVEIGTVKVEFDDAQVSQADIEAAINNAGYKVVQ